MSDSVNISRSMVSFDTAEQFDGYSKVIVVVSDEIEYSAGTDTGRTLKLNCPWGSQDVANSILESVKGFRYQPMTAEDALIDPSVELGDGISANGVYSGVYSLETKFNSNLPATVSAPSDEELHEEHTYIPKSERVVTRKLLDIRSQLRIQEGRISAEVEERKNETDSIHSTLELQAGQIIAKVNKNGGDPSSFGWALDDASWTIKANSQDVLKATKDGLDVYGRITATGGKIGGFDILGNYLSYNGQTWDGTNTLGAYLGVNGIQLGKNFKVDMAGNLYATSGTFEGNVRAGSIQYGGDNGTLSGAALAPKSISGGSSGKIALNTLGTVNLVPGINTSLGYADFANGVFNGYSEAPFIKCLRVTCSGAMSAGRLSLAGRDVALQTMSVSTPDGSTKTIRYLGWSY